MQMVYCEGHGDSSSTAEAGEAEGVVLVLMERRGLLVKRNDIAFLPVSRGQVLVRLVFRAIELELLAANVAQVQLPVSCQWVTSAQLLHL